MYNYSNEFIVNRRLLRRSYEKFSVSALISILLLILTSGWESSARAADSPLISGQDSQRGAVPSTSGSDGTSVDDSSPTSINSSSSSSATLLGRPANGFNNLKNRMNDKIDNSPKVVRGALAYPQGISKIPSTLSKIKNDSYYKLYGDTGQQALKDQASFDQYSKEHQDLINQRSKYVDRMSNATAQGESGAGNLNQSAAQAKSLEMEIQAKGSQVSKAHKNLETSYNNLKSSIAANNRPDLHISSDKSAQLTKEIDSRLNKNSAQLNQVQENTKEVLSRRVDAPKNFTANPKSYNDALNKRVGSKVVEHSAKVAGRVGFVAANAVLGGPGMVIQAGGAIFAGKDQVAPIKKSGAKIVSALDAKSKGMNTFKKAGSFDSVKPIQQSDEYKNLGKTAQAKVDAAIKENPGIKNFSDLQSHLKNKDRARSNMLDEHPEIKTEVAAKAQLAADHKAKEDEKKLKPKLSRLSKALKKTFSTGLSASEEVGGLNLHKGTVGIADTLQQARISAGQAKMTYNAAKKKTMAEHLEGAKAKAKSHSDYLAEQGKKLTVKNLAAQAAKQKLKISKKYASIKSSIFRK